MSFGANHVTNAILQRAFKEGRQDMSPMKIQKMLFYTHGWYLAVTGVAAIDKPFEVWRYGPVVGSVYHELSRFGSSNVTEYIKEYHPETETNKAFVVNRSKAQFYEVLDLAWEKYIGISAVQLSAMTHEPGSPWDISGKMGKTVIDNDEIKKYFIGIAKQ
jgi:uncharacterized phage-associated protein